MTKYEDVDPVIHTPPQDHATELQAADDSLAIRVEALRQVIAELSPEVTRLQTEQKSVWSWLKSGAGFIAFDVLITIVGLMYGIYLHRIESNNEALLGQVKTQQVQLNTSIHETCNLYGLFFKFYSPAAAGRFVQGPVVYDQLYTQLQRSSDNLRCGLPHVVPGT